MDKQCPDDISLVPGSSHTEVVYAPVFLQAAITKYHRPSSLYATEMDLSQFWRLEV